MLCRFKNRLILDESTNSMNEKIFLKKIDVTRFIGILPVLRPMYTALTLHIIFC